MLFTNIAYVVLYLNLGIELARFSLIGKLVIYLLHSIPLQGAILKT